MVAADVGITLMPIMAVKPPIAATKNLAIRYFDHPVPSRTIALVWRISSALSGFLKEVAQCLKSLPPDLLKP
jgi:LysR family hydrogen peroxide-inducible transcriptional activator